jgi:hypothetical protein
LSVRCLLVTAGRAALAMATVGAAFANFWPAVRK